MFWGLILKANKKYTQVTKQSFHISQAALDATSAAEGPIQLFLTYESQKYLICTLRKNSVEQVMLDLNFNEGDEISLQSQGNGTIHISGYVTELNSDGFDDYDDESETETETEGNKGGIKKVKCVKKTAMQKKFEDALVTQRANEDDEDDSDFKGDGATSESGSGSDSDDDSEIGSGEEEGEEEEDEGEEDDEEDESEDEEVQQPKAKQPKLEKPKQNGVETQKKEKEIVKPQKKDKKEQQPKQQKPGETIVLSGGVKIEDLRVGNGPECKPGKKALVYYEGRLKSNNKVFDSLKQGTPFKFHVGHGNVIKGWELGVPGMKVGGKRRITCPPHMAYGARGSPPTIPANSTLVFEVELKGVQ